MMKIETIKIEYNNGYLMLDGEGLLKKINEIIHNLNELENSFEQSRSINVERFQNLETLEKNNNEKIDIQEKQIDKLIEFSSQANEGFMFISENLKVIESKFKELKNASDQVEKKGYYESFQAWENHFKQSPQDYLFAKKGTFEWALIQMKNCKSIRRKSWIKVHFLCLDIEKNTLWKVNVCHMPVKIDLFTFEEITATDWEVYEIQS